MPDWSGEVRRRLAGLDLAPAREAEIVEEMAQHLDDRYQELRGRGLAEGAARDAALAELSEADALAGELRRAGQRAAPSAVVPGGGGRGRLAAVLAHDLRYGLRTLRVNP